MYCVECAKDIIHLQNAISQDVTFVRKMPGYIFNAFAAPILYYTYACVGANVNWSLQKKLGFANGKKVGKLAQTEAF